jgi:dynein light chain LC8-type
MWETSGAIRESSAPCSSATICEAASCEPCAHETEWIASLVCDSALPLHTVRPSLLSIQQHQCLCCWTCRGFLSPLDSASLSVRAEFVRSFFSTVAEMNKKPVDLDGVPEVQLHFCDLSAEARDVATQTAKLAWLNKSKSDFQYWQQCAELIKVELEKSQGPTWHVIVGEHFGAFVAHEVGKCIYFQVGQMVSWQSEIELRGFRWSDEGAILGAHMLCSDALVLLCSSRRSAESTDIQAWISPLLSADPLSTTRSSISLSFHPRSAVLAAFSFSHCSSRFFCTQRPLFSTCFSAFCGSGFASVWHRFTRQ